MNNIIRCLVLIFLLSCSSSKTSPKLKTYENKDFVLQYKKSWKQHNNHDFLAFSPKLYLRDGMNFFDNLLTIYKLDHERIKNLTIEDHINKKKEHAIKYTTETHFSQKSLDTKKGVAIVVELDKKGSRPMKEISFYYTHEDIIYELEYQATTDIYNDYINEALAIIDSFEFKSL